MAEPLEIVGGRRRRCSAPHRRAQPARRQACLITSGPTHEPIDPVRYIANRSSGKQGYAIAAAAAALGAERDAGLRPGHAARSGGRHDRAGAKRARHARRPSRRRCRPMSPSSRRRSPTGAPPSEGEQKIKKDGSGPPRAGARREPRHPGHRRRSRNRNGPTLVVGFAAETEKVDRARQGEAQAQGLRLDRGQRRLAKRRRDGRRRQHRASHHRRPASRQLADAIEGRRRAQRSRARIERTATQMTTYRREVMRLPHGAGPAAARLSNRGTPPAWTWWRRSRPTRR